MSTMNFFITITYGISLSTMTCVLCCDLCIRRLVSCHHPNRTFCRDGCFTITNRNAGWGAENTENCCKTIVMVICT